MNINNTILFASALTLSTLLSFQTAQASAGKVLFVIGQGEIVDSDYNTRPLRRGSILNPGDEVTTERGSRAQLKMTDGSFFSLRPNTQFQIKEFEYKEKESDKSFFGLLRGGFRAITGLIGKNNRSAYSITTPVATMGIRGTHYTALLCQQGDCNDNGANVNDGLYVGVAEGGISIINESGIIDIDPQQFGFVEGAFSIPTLLPSPPDSLLNESSGSGKAAARAPSEQETAQDSESTTEDDKQVAENDTTSDKESDNKVEAKANDGGILNLVEIVAESNINDTSIGATTPFSFSTAALSKVGNNVAVTLQATENSKFELTEFTRTENSFTTNSNIDTGYDATTGLAWGRWNSGTLNNTAFTDDLHWATGPNVVMPSTGTATYQLVGGTAPTDGAGATGVLGDASLKADFIANQISETKITIGLGSNIWQAADSTARAINNSTFTGTLTGSITDITTPANSTTITSGNYSGAFTGANASGVALSYSVSGTPSGTATTLNGSVGLAKQ